MPTAVRDASLVTTRNRNNAEFSYYTAWKNQTSNSTGTVNSALKQPVVGGANSISEVTLGGITTNAFNNEFLKNGANPTAFSTLGYDPNVALYPNNPSSGGAGRRF
jgi:hypothetical protein